MNLTDNQKAWIASCIQTFLATFLSVAGATLQSGIQWNIAFWYALILTAVRGAIKAIMAGTPFPLLGGKK